MQFGPLRGSHGKLIVSGGYRTVDFQATDGYLDLIAIVGVLSEQNSQRPTRITVSFRGPKATAARVNCAVLPHDRAAVARCLRIRFAAEIRFGARGVVIGHAGQVIDPFPAAAVVRSE